MLTKRNGISLAEIELGISVVERIDVATAALARATDNGDAFIWQFVLAARGRRGRVATRAVHVA